MKSHLRLLLILSLLVSASQAFAQGTVRGFVKDKETGEPILFMNVGFEGTVYGGTTDENGYYSLTKIPAGKYVLVAKNIEFKEFRLDVTVEDGKVYSRNILLEKNEIELNEVVISGEKSDQKNKVNISVQSIDSQDIKRVPTVGGQADLVQALTTLPGFVSTGDQGGQIFVRGGSPVQNKVLLDGMLIYNPFHSIGLFSVFETDIIANADVYTGGFGAQYGGRLSSVMDITTRDGNKGEVNGKVGVSPIGARFVLEGPLKKINDKGAGISYVLTAKKSYLDQSSKTFYPYVNDGKGLPFNYTDLYGKISFGGGNGSKLNLFGFSFNDKVSNYNNLANFGWKNNGFGGNFVVVPATSAVLINGNFAWSKYNITLDEANLQPRTSGITSFNFGLDFKYIIKKDVLNYGIDVVGFNTTYRSFNPLNIKIEEDQNQTELNGFVTYRFNRERFVFEPGLRMQYYSSVSVFSPEPRLGFKFKWTDRLRIKLATGLYSQNLMATNSDRDVVNLFYGFLAGPDELQNTFTRPDKTVRNVNNRIQKAIHYVAGFEFDLTERININFEGYYRDFMQVINQNRNKLFADDLANADTPDIYKKDYIIESGWAAGGDMVVKYQNKTTYLYLVYSLAKVQRWDGNQWYSPVFDRRHNINLVASKKFGKNREYEFSARWNLGSGLPFTQTQGFYEPTNLSQGINSSYINSNSSVIGTQYAGLNGGRLPYYHRLDVNVRRTVKFKKSSLEVNVGVSNAYNRQNVFYINRVTGSRVNQLPILPSVGIEFGF